MAATITFCTNAHAFQGNKILDPEVARKYPGALWVSELAYRLQSRGIEIITGDVAILRIERQELDPAEVLIIQEDTAADAGDLIRRGASPFIMMCCESPLFAADFYKNLPLTSARFEHCILFRGLLDAASPRSAKHVLHFPSFQRSQHLEHVPWENRKLLVMVTGNKYWKIRRPILRGIAAYVRDVLFRPRARLSAAYAPMQLHDERLALLAHFGARGELDLFGGQWDDIGNLPRHWQKKLQGVIEKLHPSACADKLQVISNYRFAICFENIAYPGYVTEKIFDCLLAGVIPVYLGAPDISEFVPLACFIDARRFASPGALGEYLQSLSDEDAVAMLECGRAFLNSPSGQLYSYEGFADSINGLLEHCV